MTEHKFAIGTDWRTRGGWKAVVSENNHSDPVLPIRVMHGSRYLRVPKWHRSDGTVQSGRVPDFDLIAPWDATPSAKDEAFKAMLAALKEIHDQDVMEVALDPEWPSRIAGAAIKQAEACND